jgi:DNA replication and repair protein RecF
MPSRGYRVTRLALDHFRSWSSTVVDFGPALNVLVGNNGIGKTNLVEAVEFLASGSSHRASAPKYLVQHGQPHAVIRANISVDDPASKSADTSVSTSSEPIERTIEATIPVRGAVRSRVNSGPSRYFRQIVGMLKAVLFSPHDQQLVTGDPAGRRAFLDQTATMMYPGYYELRQSFRQIARQRGIVLKRLSRLYGQEMAEQQAQSDPMVQPVSSVDRQMMLAELETWTSQFIDTGMQITQVRNKVINRLAEPFTRICARLSDKTDQARLTYEPSFAEVIAAHESEPESASNDSRNGQVNISKSTEIKKQIAQHFQRIFPGEQARGISLIGPQRDDFLFSLDDVPAREFASNGEMWTMALALRMAQFECLKMDGLAPVLILDDVFAQLDEERRRRIMQFACEQGQTLITVAAKSDIPDSEVDSQSVRVIDVAQLAQAEQAEEVEKESNE